MALSYNRQQNKRMHNQAAMISDCSKEESGRVKKIRKIILCFGLPHGIGLLSTDKMGATR
jgi:hypothetical protein